MLKHGLLAFSSLALSFAAAAQETPAPAVSKADAAKVLKATQAKKAANVSRVAVTSCNVLFGTETSANSDTQAGFGDPNGKRVEASVSSTYQLQGLDNATLQSITESICADATAQLASSYTVVPAADVATDRSYIKLHAGGRATPFTLERSDAKYLVFAPAGQSVVDLAYQGLSTLGTFSAIGKAISSGGGSEADEGALLKSLDASGVRINVMVDFAKQKANKVKGFLGKMAGNDEAKVSTQLQLSISGFVRITPVDKLKGYAGGVHLIDADDIVRFTTEVPLQSSANVVVSVADIQSKGSKAGEVGANILAGAMALSGISTRTTSIERNGVTVDNALYASETRRLSSELVGMAAALAKP